MRTTTSSNHPSSSQRVKSIHKFLTLQYELYCHLKKGFLMIKSFTTVHYHIPKCKKLPTIFSKPITLKCGKEPNGRKKKKEQEKNKKKKKKGLNTSNPRKSRIHHILLTENSEQKTKRLFFHHFPSYLSFNVFTPSKTLEMKTQISTTSN